MSINFDENYWDIFNVSGIKKNLKSAFSDVESVVKMIWENIPLFLQTWKFNTASLKQINQCYIIKCRIKKPWCGTSDGYRAVYYFDEQNQNSKLLLLYSKNDIPDNGQETQQIRKKLKCYYPDLVKIFTKT